MSNAIDHEMIPGMGTGFLKRMFASGTFFQALIELIKDGLDWGATEIRIDTNRKGWLIYTDNGVGMSRKNRRAFISFNMTTARATHGQAGRQGSGTKYMLARSTLVNVRTRAEDELDQVVTFSASIEAIEHAMLKQEPLAHEITEVTPHSWPFEMATGTRLEYELESNRSIPRGDRLARELAERLTRVVATKVLVDGKPLPEPEINGEKFVHEVVHPWLGRISIELMRPKRRHGDDSVFFTPNEIGEASYRDFLVAAGESNRSFYPEILSVPEVHGTISAAFLADFAVDDRTRFSERLASDKRVRIFASFLSSLAPKIEEVLGVSTRKQENDALNASAMADDVSEKFGGLPPLTYRLPPPTHPTGLSDDPPAPSGPTKNKTGVQVVCLTPDREVGEEIVIYAYLRDKELLAAGKGWDDLKIRFDVPLVDYLGTTTKGGKGWRFKAKAQGRACFTVYVDGHTDCSGGAYVEVVVFRALRISPQTVTIRAGKSVDVTVGNVDRLRGPGLMWRTNGVAADLLRAEDGASAKITPLQPNTTLEVTAYDPAFPTNAATCTIIATEGDRKRIRIQDSVFWFYENHVTGDTDNEMFAFFREEMTEGEGHSLYVNTGHSRLLRAAAISRELLNMVFRQELAARYAQFYFRTLNPDEGRRLMEQEPLTLVNRSLEMTLSLTFTMIS